MALGWMTATVTAFSTLAFAAVRLKNEPKPVQIPVKQEPILSLPGCLPPVQVSRPASPPIEPQRARRFRFDHYQGSRRQVMIPAKAADALIAFANGDGYVGYFAAKEVAALWETACEMLDIEPMDIRLIYEALEAKGLKVGQKRLNSPTFLEVKQRIGRDRAVIYRIPKSRASAGSLPETSKPFPTQAERAPVDCRQPSASIAEHQPDYSEMSNELRRVA